MKTNERSPTPVDERSRLASILDRSNENSQVEIVTTLVDTFGPTENCHFEVVPGEKVIARYRRGDFINITRPDGEAGFVPVKICFLVAEKASFAVKERNGSTPSIKSNSHASTPSIKSSSPVCNSVNVISSNASLQKSLEPSLNPEIADEAECSSAANAPTEEEGEVENRPVPNSLMEANDSECDSLARRVKRHEIRQLLKREASQKILSSNSSIQELADQRKPSREISVERSNGVIHKTIDSETDHGLSHLSHDDKEREKVQYGSQKVLLLPQTPILKNSNLSLNSRSDCAKDGSEKTGSRLSINSIQKDLRGSQRSLNSLRSKNYSLVARNMPPQSTVRHVGLHPRYFTELQQARLDSHSISSYDGSLQEIYSSLNGDFAHFPPRPNEGFFYQTGSSPEFSGQRLIDLQRELPVREPPFHRGRRCTSLRRGPNYAWFPQNHLNGFARLADDERAWNYLAENTSARGPLFTSPFRHENSQGLSDSSSLGNETAMFAMKDFQAVEEDELTMRKGERVSLVKKDSEDWWWVLNSRGERGLVPSYFLIPLLQPSRQDSGVLSGPSYGLPNGMYIDPSHNVPYNGTDRRMEELLARYGVESERRESEGANGLTRSNTIGSDFRNNKGSRIDWRKVYNTENGPRGLSNLKDLNTTRENIDDVKAKEKLLQKIRNEVMMDPVKDFLKKKSLSNENMHKISIANEGTERYLQETLRRKDLAEKIPAVNDRHATIETEDVPASSENVVTSQKLHTAERKPPSYDQCIDQLSRDQRSDAAIARASSNFNSELFETPRILRRRLTYSGGASRKVKFTDVGNDSKEGQTNDGNCAMPEGKSDDGISTWC